MAPKKRYLSKSRYKIGCECPTKLFFTGKSQYGNSKLDNAFLNALAEGGFQVGELAKLYYPGGIEIETLEIEKALSETEKLLTKNSVIIYEPAIRFKNLLVRVDILVKDGDSVELIEVKAKSFDPSVEDQFFKKRELKKGLFALSAEWEPYLLDIAFQTYVTKSAFPKWNVTSSLMLADKTKVASVDGLNQRFLLVAEAGGRTRAVVKPGTTQNTLGEKILTKISVDEIVNNIFKYDVSGKKFELQVADLAKAYELDQMLPPVVGSHCKSCEFRIDDKMKKAGLKSGFEECWQESEGLKKADFERPMVFEIWNFRKASKLVDDGRFFISDVDENDIAPTPRTDGSGLSSSERQWLQVKKLNESDTTPYVDVDGLRAEMSKWKFPLHFIDFETTTVAIPFNKGRRPYEQVAFQFSHHIVTENGKIVHVDEFINKAKGLFPNFNFVRALKRSLETDEGTIFRYATHENTVLCQIRDQLLASKESDREELISFIETITEHQEENAEWIGSRNMVDMCELVKRHFYHPLTNGSNSIKKVLPAVLNESLLLKTKYSKPIYGSSPDVSSKNFKNWIWIELDHSGKVIDPYKRLPPVFDDIDLESLDSVITEGNIADGGAAMTAYARMQFTEMSDVETEKVSNALLKYCELDTFAMVLIYEYWKSAVEELKKDKAA